MGMQESMWQLYISDMAWNPRILERPWPSLALSSYAWEKAKYNNDKLYTQGFKDI